MAFILQGKNGTNNAQIGDFVVTGGGVFQKTENGSVKISDLKGGNTGSYADLVSKFSKHYSDSAGISGSGRNIADSNILNPTPSPEIDYDLGVDNNGIAMLGYDPNQYVAAYSSSSSTSSTLNTIFGYVIVGLVGLVVLNRFAG